MSNAPSLTVSESGSDAAQAAAAEREATTHPQFENAVIGLQRQLEQRCEQARQDSSLGSAERHDVIRGHWHQATETYQHLREATTRQLEADVEERENALFRVDHHARSDVRDAYEIVYSATKGSGEQAREELERYAERARRTGDKALETACGHIAIERGISSIRDAYLSASKERTRNWELYKRARIKQDSFERLRLTIAAGAGFSLVMPAELRS